MPELATCIYLSCINILMHIYSHIPVLLSLFNLHVYTYHGLCSVPMILLFPSNPTSYIHHILVSNVSS